MDGLNSGSSAQRARCCETYSAYSVGQCPTIEDFTLWKGIVRATFSSTGSSAANFQIDERERNQFHRACCTAHCNA